MAVAREELQAPPMTYEEYLAEGEVFQRYDIIDGVRISMNPTRRHQQILMNVAEVLRHFERLEGIGRMVIAPCDVLIRRAPLRTRQPDVLFISHARLARNSADTDASPLSPAPELVVEILSPSETRKNRDGKIADYQSVGVRECWIVSPDERTVAVLRLSPERVEVAAIYGEGEETLSEAFPGLRVPAAGVFAE